LGGIVFAELLLDGLHLAAQDVIALLLGHLLLGFGDDLLAHLEDTDLVGDVGDGELEGVPKAAGRKQRLELIHIEMEGGGEKPHDLLRIVGAGEEVGDLLGGLRVDAFNGLGGELEQGGLESLLFGGVVRGEGHRDDFALEVRALGFDADDADAFEAGNDDFDEGGRGA